MSEDAEYIIVVLPKAGLFDRPLFGLRRPYEWQVWYHYKNIDTKTWCDGSFCKTPELAQAAAECWIATVREREEFEARKFEDGYKGRTVKIVK